MKGILLTLLLSVLCLTGAAKSDFTHLVIHAKDGTKVAYALENKPKVTFSETDLIISADNVNVAYPLQDMATIVYETGIESGIIDLQTEEPLFQLVGETLLFHAQNTINTISIYSISGNNILTKTIPQDVEYAFPLSQLTYGVYIVKLNGLTYKIVKR